MKWTFAAALAAIALPSAAQTVTVTYTDQRAMSAAGYQMDDYHQERIDHWRGEIARKSDELRAQANKMARDAVHWSPDVQAREQQRMAKLEGELTDLNTQAVDETEQLAAIAKAGFRGQAAPYLKAFSQANAIGEILVDPADDDGSAFVVLNPAYDISARIGEMVKSGPGAEVAAGPNRPPVIRYVIAADAYYDSGLQAAREGDLIEEMLDADEDFLAQQQVLNDRMAGLDRQRLLMTPEEQDLAEMKLMADSVALREAYDEQQERNLLRRKQRLASFKNDVYIFLSNNPDLAKADIVRFLDDDSMVGTVFVSHPDLDITDLVTARMTAPE